MTEWLAIGCPDLRFDLIGGGLVDSRSDARDSIEPRKLIFKIRREIIIEITHLGVIFNIICRNLFKIECRVGLHRSHR
jgi:hypothetical protein